MSVWTRELTATNQLEQTLAATVLVLGVGLTVSSIALGPMPAEKTPQRDWTSHAILERTLHGENDPWVDGAGRLMRRERLQLIGVDRLKDPLRLRLAPRERQEDQGRVGPVAGYDRPAKVPNLSYR
jgi:hypothetical protein